MIPNGVIFPWNGTHTGIPSGWQRETALDGKYPKAWSASVAPNNTGGSNTHTHTGSHTHTIVSHSHTYSTGYGNESPQQSGGSGSNISSHTHSNHSINSTTGGGLQNTTVTWSSVNHEPPYYTVIFVRPSGSMAFLASGFLAYYNGANSPSGWKFCDGNAGSPDLRGKYIKGANTGADAGSTGGSTSHVHTISHTHTVTAHGHSGTASGIGSSYGGRGYSSNPVDGSFVRYDHEHTVTLSDTTDTINSYTNTTAGGETIDLEYKKMAIYLNTGGGIVKGIIGMWLGNTTDIPIGWYLCDGNNGTVDLRDKFIKIGQDLTQNGLTGGSNTHTHSPVSHTHTATGTHTHTGTHGNAIAWRSDPSGTGGGACYWDHTHAITNVSSETTTWGNSDVSADTVSNQPGYRTVAYIEYQFSAGGSFLLNLV